MAALVHEGRQEGRAIEDEDLLISVSGGLGRFDEEKEVYRKDADCVECLKDLQRFLRRDDPYERQVFFRLGQWDLVSTDLVPLIVQYQEDGDVVYNALKVLTFLTMPLDFESDHVHMQLKYLKRIKECFLANDAVAVIVGLLTKPLARYPRLSEKDVLVVQLVLTFVRNLLCIDNAARDFSFSGGERGDGTSFAQEEEQKGDLLLRLFKDNVLELVLLVSQHCSDKAFKKDAPLILHIVHQVFEGFSSSQLFSAEKFSSSSSGVGKKKQTKRNVFVDTKKMQMKGDLQKALLSEKRTRISSRSNVPMRHRLFSGTFVKKYNDISQQVVFTQRSVKPGIEKDEQTYKSSGRGRKTAQEKPLFPMNESLRELLRNFVENFLQGGYDILMDSIRPELMHGIGISRLEKEDYMRFFRLSCFCTSYMKLKMEKIGEAEFRDKYEVTGRSPFSEISSTMGWDMCHLLLTVWQHQIEIPSRAEEKDWDLQASSLALLKEMMYVLNLAYRIGTKTDRKAADKLQRKLLHDDLRQSGLFPLLCRMIKNYNARIQPLSQAGDMMEALYIIIHTFERLDRTERGGFIVRRRATGGKRKRKDDDKEKSVQEQEKKSVEEQEKDGEEKEKDGEEQDKDGEEQEKDKDGEEKEKDKEEVEKDKEDDASAEGEKDTGKKSERSKAPLEELLSESEESEVQMKEATFDLNHRLSQELSAPLLMNTIVCVLENYRTNSQQLNNSVVSILKRVVLPDCMNLMPCVWHLRFLMVMEKVLSDGDKTYSQMKQLFKYIQRKLMDRLLPDTSGDQFEKAAKEAAARMTFVDLLFWKHRRDAELVRDEYGVQNKGKFFPPFFFVFLFD